MKYVEAKPSRLHCSQCDVTYKLPQNGFIKLYGELKCPLDNFELVIWTTGAKGKVGLTTTLDLRFRLKEVGPSCYQSPHLLLDWLPELIKAW